MGDRLITTRLSPPQEDLDALYQAILAELLEERVSSSRGRINPRAVKRKMSSFPTKSRNPQRGTVRHDPVPRFLVRDYSNGIEARVEEVSVQSPTRGAWQDLVRFR